MDKIDLKKRFKELYRASTREFCEIHVPTLTYLKVDGAGDPNSAAAYREAITWLYGVSYAVKFAAKALGQDYVVPPLEALWWADDPGSFVRREKETWRWTVMIPAPDIVTDAMFEAAAAKIGAKLGPRPVSLRFEPYAEGRSLQILHIGRYDDEGPTLARLHHEVMPGRGVTFNGPHHEIYLSDPRKTEAAKLRTILRQPIR
ncbi:GyrI-like domain-containing protein [Methylorubrum zatmanii]